MRFGIYTCLPDGSDLQRVGEPTPYARNHCHVFGSWIVCVAYRRDVTGDGVVDEADAAAAQVVLLPLAGGPEAPVTDIGYRLAPAWTPDGAVLYVSDEGQSYPGFMEIQRQGLSGQPRRNLTNTTMAIEADPAQTGNVIVYSRLSPGETNRCIWRGTSTGAYPRRLTMPLLGPSASPLPLGDYDPKLSPSGRYVAFERHQSDALSVPGWPAPLGQWDICIYDLYRGRTRVRVGGPSVDLMPAWSPDGARLAYWQLWPLHTLWTCEAAGVEAPVCLFPDRPDLLAEMPDWYTDPDSGDVRLIFSAQEAG